MELNGEVSNFENKNLFYTHELIPRHLSRMQCAKCLLRLQTKLDKRVAKGAKGPFFLVPNFS